MNNTKLYKYASLCVIGVTMLIVVYLAFDYVMAAVLPFALSWGVALLLRPLSHRIYKVTRLNERVIRLLLAMLSSAVFISAVVGVLWYVVNKSWQLLSGIDANNEIISAITSFLNGGFFSKFIFGEEFSEYIRKALDGIASTLMKNLADIVSGVAAKLPRVFVFTLVTIISAAYFAYDLEGINAAVKSVLPERAIAFSERVRRAFKSVGVRYIRSYLTIMAVTFATLFVGFLIIGIEYAALIALFVAVLDILPVFGVGTVLIPWSIIGFIVGDFKIGVGILLLFLFITVLREIVEPKILGKNLGLHPLLTLILLYIGYSFFGFVGMILLPPLGALVGVMLREK